MTCFPAPTTKLYFSGAFSVTLLTMAYRNAGVKHFLDVNMVKLFKIGKCLLQKKNPITHYAFRIMHYHNAARPCGLAEKGKVRAFRP